MSMGEHMTRATFDILVGDDLTGFNNIWFDSQRQGTTLTDFAKNTLSDGRFILYEAHDDLGGRQGNAHAWRRARRPPARGEPAATATRARA